MALSEERIVYLLQAYTDGTATHAEEEDLLQWVAGTTDRKIIRDHIQKLVEQHTNDTFSEVNWEVLYRKVLQKTKQGNSRRIHWYRVAAAVAALLVLGSGIYLFSHKKQAAPVLATNTTQHDKNDIRPGSAKAILKAGNMQVVLNKKDTSFTLAGNTVHIAGGNVKIADVRPIQYTLITPRGGDYSLVLADGTKVWLNADSKLVYPSVFTGGTREVTLEGEAYFEVHTDAAHPFIVKSVRQNIRVLGTEFNVHAYADEADVVTTLVRGKVQVNSSDMKLILQPGQQTQLDQSGKLRLSPNADVEEAIAWKNGYFLFHKADIHTIMNSLARWYDIEVHYSPDLKSHYFGAIISRDNNISGILNMLEATGDVDFEIEGKEVMVMP